MTTSLYILYCSFHNRSFLLASSFKIGQELDLIIEVVEQHAGTELIIGDSFIVDLVCLCILLEGDRLVQWVHDGLDDISFGELKGLYAVVMLCLCVAPTSTVCADHVGSVADSAEIEAVVLACYYFRVAHADCDPIRGGLFDSEGEFLEAISLL